MAKTGRFFNVFNAFFNEINAKTAKMVGVVFRKKVIILQEIYLQLINDMGSEFIKSDTMTQRQKQMITKLRQLGFGYRSIAKVTNLKLHQVRDYCRYWKL